MENNLIDAMRPYFKREGRELDFFQRVYSGDWARYHRRLKPVGFTGGALVLDAGAGYGQWTLALSRSNHTVIALEKSAFRCQVLKKIAQYLNITNVLVIQGSIEELPVKRDRFDGIFCYSVIYQVDWKRALGEFSEVLVPGGRLYLSANGLGWALHNIISQWNPSVDFNPRRHALASILKSLSLGLVFKHSDWILAPRQVMQRLKKIGFHHCRAAGDGKINLNSKSHDKNEKPGNFSFYPARAYGFSNVFEIAAEKDG